jgi:serine protease Do
MKRAVIALFVLGAQAFAQTSPPKLKLGDALPQNLFVELSRALNPTVVNISTTSAPRQAQRGGRGGFGADPLQEFMEQFMGPQGPARPQQSLGTGFIIRKDGLIVTNNHVIEGAASIKVQLEEKAKTLFEAEVIGRDKRTDIALIKISAGRELPVAHLGSSASIQVGEWVLALGNPLGLGHSVSKGIVSALGREIDEINKFPFIQTDALINPGNSGGPLVNTKGEVVGVNTAIAQGQGIGFAIPIDDVKSILPSLEKDGLIRRAFVGVNMHPYPLDPRDAAELKLPTTDGALVIGVMEKGPAAKAGLKEYDFVTKFDGKSVESSSDFSRLVQDSKVGRSYEIEYVRKGQKRKASVTLAEHPEDQKKPEVRKKSYGGQKAPFGLGFTITNSTNELVKEMGLPALRQRAPVVIEIEPDSPAARSGLGVGDIILDVNRSSVSQDVDVLRALRQGQINSLRILRGGGMALIYMNPKAG